MAEVQEFKISLSFDDNYQPGGKFSVTVFRSDRPNNRIVTYLYDKDFLWAVFVTWGRSTNEIKSLFDQAAEGKESSFFVKLDRWVLTNFVTLPFFQDE